MGNVHEAAQRCHSRARVAYVDWEAIAVHHARRLLDPEQTRVTVTQADVCEPDAVLNSPGVNGLLDFTRPVGILALGILDITTPTGGAANVMARYRDACCRDSALAVSNTAQLTASDTQVSQINALMAGSSTSTLHWRSREQVAALLPGYELLEPGVVPTAAWRPEHAVSDAEAARANAYAAVGMLR